MTSVEKKIKDHLKSSSSSDTAIQGAKLLLDRSNLDLITDIPEPVGVSILEQMKDHLRDKFEDSDDDNYRNEGGCVSANTISNLLQNLKENRISFKRKSREEIKDILTGSAPRESESLRDRLFSSRDEVDDQDD